MKRGTNYYKGLLTNQALLLEQHPCCDDQSRTAAQLIRLAVKYERPPFAVLETMSKAAALILRSLDLAQRYLPGRTR